MNILVHLADLVVHQAEGGEQPFWFSMAPLVLMFLVIYFLLIRPASKQRKEHASLLNKLKKDDEVVTSGGVYGKIVSLDDKVVTIEIADKVKIKILRDRIAGLWTPTQAVEKK